MEKYIPDLKKRDRILSRLIKFGSFSVMVTDQNGNIEYVNPSFEEKTGYTKEEIVGKNSRILSSGKNSLEVYKQLWETILSGFEWRGELCNQKKNGELFWEYLIISPLESTGGELPHYIAIMNDITERKKVSEVNQKTIEILNETGRLAKVGGWELDISTGVQVWTDEIYHILEIDILKEKMRISKGVNFYSPESRPIIKLAVERAIKYSEPYDLELEVITKKGNRRWIHTNGKANQKNGKTVTISGAIQDITYRKKMEEELRESEKKYRELSIIDSLTLLYNSRHFYEQLKTETDRANRHRHPVSIVLIDIDNFKVFNDTYGHIEGDEVLIRFGQVVKKCLRQTDSAYRYGGEEFTVILPETTTEKAVIVAEKIRKKFKSEIFSVVLNQDVHVTISVGVAQYSPKEDLRSFVGRADTYMYEAKNGGKDRVAFETLTIP